MYFLLIAYYLSILTFYLGVLIYALPIPLTGLKKWAPRLLTDAFFIAILTLSLGTIINVADYIRTLIGGSWENFLLQTKTTIIFRTVIVFLFSIIGNLFSKFLPGINRLITLIINPILASLYSNMLMYSIATMIYKGVWLISSLGIVLMAIPFRIARNAGAFLFSFALVFYIALPLYPSFYRILIYSPSTPLEIPIIYGSIVNEFNQPITSGYIGFEINTNEYIGPLPLYSNNYMLLTTNTKLMSSLVTIYFDAAGHQFYTNISNVDLHNICIQNINREAYLNVCRIDVMVRGLIAYSNGMALHIAPKPNNIIIDVFSKENIKMYIDTQIDAQLYVSLTNMYDVEEITIDNATLDSIDNLILYQWYWYNLMGRTYVIDISQGQHVIEIKMKYSNEMASEPSEIYIYNAIQQLFPTNNPLFTDIINEINRIIYIDLIASIMYLSILISITWGFSRLLGGSSRIRVFI
jgi:hypothetical protein